MRRVLLTVGLFALETAFAADPPPPRVVRATGVIEAVHSLDVRVPLIEGQGGNVTLTKLTPNGVHVRPGELLAEFDSTAEVKAQREAQAKYDDLSHQVEQKRAEHNSNAEKRQADLQGAEADLNKAQIDLRKGPILSDIEQQKNRVKLDDAVAHVASLHRSQAAHDRSEIAEIRILELQRDRQKIAVDRAQRNIEKLAVRAPIPGIVALQNVWRNGSMGHAEEGDQLWPGSDLIRLFDPSQMAVQLTVAEPDGAVLVPGTHAQIRLDAFPQLSFSAHFDSASPVATSAMDSPLKTFTAKFILDQSDSHLLPDLSAAVDIAVPK
jgi:membrane fusion protein (multidrug efflux system)